MAVRWCWLALSAVVAAPAAMAGELPMIAYASPYMVVPYTRDMSYVADMAAPSLEQQVLAEINRLRADPAGYAASLRHYRGFYHANIVRVPGSDADYETEEGTAPLDEAIAWLEQQAPATAYADSTVLGAAARDHGDEQAADGEVGHMGRDGSDPGERVARRGGGRYVAEVITYGSRTAADVVRQLVVDDGVPDRGHRRILFAPDFRFAGVACAPHRSYRELCVVDIARTPDAQSRWPRIEMASNG